MNKSLVSVSAPVVSAIVAQCTLHPADFLREVGKADALADTASKVGVSAGQTIRKLVGEQFAKGTGRAVIDAETARWCALSALAAVAKVRLAVLLAESGVEIGNSSAPRFKSAVVS